MIRTLYLTLLGLVSLAGYASGEEAELVPAPKLYADFDLSEYLPPAKAKTTTIQKGSGPAPVVQKIPGYFGVQFDFSQHPYPVVALDPQAPAAKSLQVGDKITLLNGKSYPKKEAFRDAIKELVAGETVVLQIERKGKTEEASVTLSPVSSPLGGGQFNQRPVFGIGTDNDSLGIRITRVNNGSAAEKADLKVNDIILKIDGKEMREPDGYNDAMSRKKPGDKVSLVVLRDKDELKKEVTLGGDGPAGGPNSLSWDSRGSRIFRNPVYKLAVLPISFTDLSINEKIAPVNWEEALFSKGTYKDKSVTGQQVYGSVNDYYNEISCGTFRVEGKVFAPVKVAQKRPDYAANTVRTALLAETVEALRKRDGEKCLEGYDGLFFLYAGTTATTQRGSLYWPHRSTFRNKGENWNYFICPEISGGRMGDTGGRMADISTITHEFGHMLGLPDLYAKPENPGSEGVGGWCAMSQQGRGGQVQHFGAWCKEQLGWVKPTIIDPSVPQKLILNPIEGTNDQCFKVLVRPDGSEYFLLENRAKVGYDKVLSGEGLLIWHVVDGKVTLEESHGITTPNGPNTFLSSVPYPTKSNSSFTPQTIPSSKPIKQGGKEVFLTNIRKLPDGKVVFQIGYEFY